MKESRTAIAYVPVLHGGYMEFFQHARASELYLVSEEVLREFDCFDYIVRKDSLRALSTEKIRVALEALHLFDAIHVLTLSNVETVHGDIVMPEEDVSHELAERYFPHKHVTYASMFLRWHRDNTEEKKQVEAHRVISVTDFDREVMQEVALVAEKSHDWWRQVAAAIVLGGEVVLVSNNKHLPNEQCPNVYGDPRAVYRRGVEINLTTAAHAEISLVAAAARRGLSLEGASMYVTDFPCPFCARMLVQSGIKKLFFTKGYAMLDGEKLLKDAGIEVVAVTI